MHGLELKQKTTWSGPDHNRDTSFELKAATALGISVIADALDYAAAPVFALPVIGDVADVFISGILYSITKSKKAAAINAIEFIPMIGDFIPAYTISTLMWIRQESSKRKNVQKIRKATIVTTTVEDRGLIPNATPVNLVSRMENNDEPDLNSKDDENEMRKLAASRYARWKERKYR